jgi:hypothetical protein
MIKINLISKKRRTYKEKNWTRISTLVVFGLFGLYFLIDTLYVVISMYTIGGRITKVNNESKAISSVMLANNEKLNRFVLTKLILTKISELNNSRFPYKEYLDNISLILPNGSSIGTVDFMVRGWIAVTVRSSNVNVFGLLEKSLLDKNTWQNNKYFSGAYIESVAKDKSGSYSTRLQYFWVCFTRLGRRGNY